MEFIWGIIIFIFSFLVWLGQIITAFSPVVAEKLGLTEPESDADPVFHLDARGEAVWDSMILWILPVGGWLLILSNSVWVYFALVGSGMLLYIGGRGISVRLLMQRHGIRIGKSTNIKWYYFFLVLSGLIALVTIFMALAAMDVVDLI